MGQAGEKVSKAEQGLAGNEKRISCRKKMFLLFRANPSYSVLIREKGFTILEVMVAVVILAFALVALLRVMPMGLKASKLGEDLTTATLLAQRRMEEIKRGGYSNIPNEGSESIAPGYDSRYEWQAISSSAGSDLKEVTVSVWWPYKAGSDHSGQRCAHLTTLMANYD